MRYLTNSNLNMLASKLFSMEEWVEICKTDSELYSKLKQNIQQARQESKEIPLNQEERLALFALMMVMLEGKFTERPDNENILEVAPETRKEGSV